MTVVFKRIQSSTSSWTYDAHCESPWTIFTLTLNNVWDHTKVHVNHSTLKKACCSNAAKIGKLNRSTALHKIEKPPFLSSASTSALTLSVLLRSISAPPVPNSVLISGLRSATACLHTHTHTHRAQGTEGTRAFFSYEWCWLAQVRSS